ncbi:uncharacterized protein LOC129600793 [Paramacrobiotus metropolitanus]|uniref:uncharacterized protein LOC129600793 n=1 Tax=Paramacrobiotus metropolitanus TaxID=2943436 RepID=UPI002445ACFC|nr:uncharacterized protein LOC129600793 [Paramacrobiotus metropolitanus]
MSDNVDTFDFEAWLRNEADGSDFFLNHSDPNLDFLSEFFPDPNAPTAGPAYADPDTPIEPEFCPRFESLSPPASEPPAIHVHLPELPGVNDLPPDFLPQPLTDDEQAALLEFLQPGPVSRPIGFVNLEVATLVRAGTLTVKLILENQIPQYGTVVAHRGRKGPRCDMAMSELRALLRFLLSTECDAMNRHNTSPNVKKCQLVDQQYRREFSPSLHAAWVRQEADCKRLLRVCRVGEANISVSTTRISMDAVRKLRKMDLYPVLLQLFPGYSQGTRDLPVGFWNDYRSYLVMECVHLAKVKDIYPSEDNIRWLVYSQLDIASFYSILIELLPNYADCSFAAFANDDEVRKYCFDHAFKML